MRTTVDKDVLIGAERVRLSDKAYQRAKTMTSWQQAFRVMTAKEQVSTAHDLVAELYTLATKLREVSKAEAGKEALKRLEVSLLQATDGILTTTQFIGKHDIHG